VPTERDALLSLSSHCSLTSSRLLEESTRQLESKVERRIIAPTREGVRDAGGKKGGAWEKNASSDGECLE
jgi:hypothetical protein